MAAKLIGNKGQVLGREVELSAENECLIGRVPSAMICVEDDLVSRKHCRIFYEGGYFVIEDLKSKNGLWVNGEKISCTPLFHGDRIVVGRQELTFELGSGAAVSEGVVLRDAPDKFSTEFKEQVPERAATQLGLSSRDSRTPRTVEEVERDLAAVCRIIDVVNREEPLADLFQRIMDLIMEITGADRGYLFSGKELGGAITPQVIRQGSELPEWLQNTFSRSVVRECYQTGYSILRADPMAQDTEPSQSIMSQQIQSLMCVPMRCEEGTVGVIYVDRLGGEKKFSKRELRVLSAIANETGIAVRRAQLTRRVETLFSDSIRTLVRIIEAKDRYTRSHSERVTGVAQQLAIAISLPEAQIRDLSLAGLLHDVGKVATPIEILNKPGKLTESEFTHVKLHATHSAQIVSGIENAEGIVPAVRHHHEKWDGTGYPDGLAGEDIPLLARILAVADAFDSMFGGRTYKDPMGEDDVLAEIELNSGTQFDPHLATEFVNAYRSDTRFKTRVTKLYAEDVASKQDSRETVGGKQPSVTELPRR